MTDEERAQRLARLHALRERIAILLLRQAQQGPGFSSAQELELHEAQQAESVLVAELGLDTVLPLHPNGITLTERVLALEFRIKALELLVKDALSAINQQLADIRDSAKEWRGNDQHLRIERQTQLDLRFSRMELAIIGIATILAVLIGYVVTQ